MPSLLVSRGGKRQAVHAITQPRTRIGRATDNALVLDSPSVSKAHAVVLCVGDDLAVQDLGSRNGTFVDGVRVVQRQSLRDGALLRIGEFELAVVADKRAMAYEPTMVARPSAAAGRALLRPLDPPAGTATVLLNKVVTNVGEPAVCQVTFIRRLDAVAVRFTDGALPAQLNGSLLPETPVRLAHGDVLQIGEGQWEFVSEDT